VLTLEEMDELSGNVSERYFNGDKNILVLLSGSVSERYFDGDKNILVLLSGSVS